MFSDAVAFLYRIKIRVDTSGNPNRKVFGNARNFIFIDINCSRIPGTACATLLALKTNALIKKIGPIV
jgi:hypothetical protein